MRYGYSCKKCGDFDRTFPIGQAPDVEKCPVCGNKSKRTFSCNFVLKGGGWPSRTVAMDRAMTAKNERAGKRMRKEHKPGMRLAALDYGNGDIREVKKK